MLRLVDTRFKDEIPKPIASNDLVRQAAVSRAFKSSRCFDCWGGHQFSTFPWQVETGDRKIRGANKLRLRMINYSEQKLPAHGPAAGVKKTGCGSRLVLARFALSPARWGEYWRNLRPFHPLLRGLPASLQVVSTT